MYDLFEDEEIRRKPEKKIVLARISDGVQFFGTAVASIPSFEGAGGSGQIS
jgi:hypothetical protein